MAKHRQLHAPDAIAEEVWIDWLLYMPTAMADELAIHVMNHAHKALMIDTIPAPNYFYCSHTFTDSQAQSPSSSVTTGALARFPGALTRGARESPSCELNFTENFSEHCSHNQKKTAACEGFRLHTALGTSLHGVLGCLMSNRYKRPPLK